MGRYHNATNYGLGSCCGGVTLIVEMKDLLVSSARSLIIFFISLLGEYNANRRKHRCKHALHFD